MTSIETWVPRLAAEAKAASRVLASVPTKRKHHVLQAVSRALGSSAAEGILAANRQDVAEAEAKGLSPAMLDRLRLDARRLDRIALAVDSVIALPDPVGAVEHMRRLPNGLWAGRMRVPLGVIAIVYEARPNVTSDAAALCLKSGNACVLRGGSEAFRTNQAIAQVYADALAAEGLPAASVSLLPTTDREAARVLLQQTGWVDLAIPRGGTQLIDFVNTHARVPVIQHYKGVCHVYVDGDADFDRAEAIAINAKVQRPGVCNAMETLLVDRACAQAFLPRMVASFASRGVEVRGDAAVQASVPNVTAATDADWDAEYLDLIVSIAVVDGIDGALAHVAKHGTLHTEAIVTRDHDKAQRWIREVDAGLVLVNASTRFNDGTELGLGAEIGISTTKMHAYGPMGLEELCAKKWIAFGEGSVRE